MDCPACLESKNQLPCDSTAEPRPHNGLCNGTRLMIRAFQDNAIDAEIFFLRGDAEIVGGQHAGKRVFMCLFSVPTKSCSIMILSVHTELQVTMKYKIGYPDSSFRFLY